MNTMTPLLCRRLSVLMIFTAALIAVIALQLSRQRRWLPTMPMSLGAWTVSEVPLDRLTLATLGNPPSMGYRFTDPFGERVDAQIVTTETYNAYHEPPICQPIFGNVKTATRAMPIPGLPVPVRGLIVQNQNDGGRILMYYWVQYRDGTIGGADASILRQDGGQRLAVGWDKTRHASPSCVVRLYTAIHPDDNLGLQARRGMNEVTRRVYEALKTEGQGASGGK